MTKQCNSQKARHLILLVVVAEVLWSGKNGKGWQNCEGREKGFGVEEKKLTDLLSSGCSLNSPKKRVIPSCGYGKGSFGG